MASHVTPREAKMLTDNGSLCCGCVSQSPRVDTRGGAWGGTNRTSTLAIAHCIDPDIDAGTTTTAAAAAAAAAAAVAVAHAAVTWRHVP